MLRRNVTMALVAAVISGIATAGSAPAASPRVSLGEVSAASGASSAERDLMRVAVMEELGALELPPRGERYVLSAALVRMEARRDVESAEIACVVSTTLRAANSGALHAIIDGRARVRDSAQALGAARREAIGRAVRSAVRRVPEAVR
jgi:hypothetical protein